VPELLLLLLVDVDVVNEEEEIDVIGLEVESALLGELLPLDDADEIVVAVEDNIEDEIELENLLVGNELDDDMVFVELPAFDDDGLLECRSPPPVAAD
jgi:hypothetical protein